MKKKYYLWIIGCQMNYSDGERVAAVLNRLGYQQTNQEKTADLIITVACSVRQTAIDRISGKAHLWQKLKQKKPLITILTGCVLKTDKPKLSHFFDYFFEIKKLQELPKFLGSGGFARLNPRLPERLVAEAGSGGFNLRRKGLRLPNIDYFKIHPQYQTNFQAYVPISTGCNNFCAYCVVPYVRGREISRPAKEIINECKDLITKGYKEITLLGQNVNSYGNDSHNQGIYPRFPELLQKISKLPGNFWLRYVTSHPKDLSNELIKVMAKNPKICPYLHLPVQAGDNQILKKMNRGYTREHYLNLIKKIRKIIPDIAISTDVIVGFPGETKKQFLNTAKLFKEIKFDMAYIAKYSPRAGTTAFKLKDNVTAIEKEKRYNILNKILNQTALEKHKKLIGKTLKVLMEFKRKNYYYSKSDAFKTVKLISPKNYAGRLVNACTAPGKWCWVKINKAQAFGLEGKLIV